MLMLRSSGDEKADRIRIGMLRRHGLRILLCTQGGRHQEESDGSGGEELHED